MSILPREQVTLGEYVDSHCIHVDKEEDCFRFEVSASVVCAFFYGLDGRAYGIRRLRFKGCDPEYITPYPACNPMIVVNEGDEHIFTKPGWYEVCSNDGEPLPKNFDVDLVSLNDCQAKAALLEKMQRMD